MIVKLKKAPHGKVYNCHLGSYVEGEEYEVENGEAAWLTSDECPAEFVPVKGAAKRKAPKYENRAVTDGDGDDA